MDAKEIAQLVHEGYHSLETIAKLANMPVSVVEEVYQEFVAAGVYTA